MYFFRGEVLQYMARRPRASYERTQRRFCDERNLARRPRAGSIAGDSVLLWEANCSQSATQHTWARPAQRQHVTINAFRELVTAVYLATTSFELEVGTDDSIRTVMRSSVLIKVRCTLCVLNAVHDRTMLCFCS